MFSFPIHFPMLPAASWAPNVLMCLCAYVLMCLCASVLVRCVLMCQCAYVSSCLWDTVTLGSWPRGQRVSKLMYTVPRGQLYTGTCHRVNVPNELWDYVTAASVLGPGPATRPGLGGGGAATIP